jgi:hypothetical protein
MKERMRCAKTRRAVLILGGLLAVLSIASAFSFLGLSEPTYESRRVSRYFDDLTSPGPASDRAINAFSHLGTRAVPFLRRSLRTKDGPPRLALLWLFSKQPFFRCPIRPAAETHRLALRAYRGLLRAVREGEEVPALADACVEEITNLARQGDSDKETSLLAFETLRHAAAAKLEAATLANGYAKVGTAKTPSPAP